MEAPKAPWISTGTGLRGKRQSRPKSTAAIPSAGEIKTQALQGVWKLLLGFPGPYDYGLGFVLLKIKSF